MSYLSDASLVMIPSGVEAGTVFTSKPAGGSADLTFTRSNDTATRVGPNGYIEKVRTNLLLQSNQFDTTWTTVNSSVTSGQSGYDGSSDAWEIGLTASGGRVQDANSQSGVQTYSVYAKAGTLDFVRLRVSITGINVDAYFNLSSGTYAGSSVGSIIDANIESVGGGWYRCSLTYDGTNTDIRIYPAIAYNDLTATSGNIYIQDAQLEYGTVATDYIPTTTAAVSVGPVANVPRINFDPVLPRTGFLLWEPQRTNLIPYSEYIADSGWTKTDATATTNYAISPDGYKNATLISFTSGGFIVESVTTTKSIGGQETISIFSNSDISGTFLKYGGGTAAGTDVEGREALGNGWFRYYVTRTFTEAETGLTQVIVAQSNVGDNVILWGAQIEQGGYPTSYIPTYGAAATRGDDAASKTGISSVIGQTEGTLFVEAKVTLNGRLLLIGTTGNFIELLTKSTGKVNAFVYNGSTQADILSTSTYATGDTLKIALAYKQNDFALYVNGTEQGTDTSANIPTGMARLIVNDYTVGGYNSANAYSQALLFQTRLTNDQLSQITTL